MSSIQHKVQVWIVHQGEVALFQVIPKRGGGWHPITGSVEPHEAASSDWLAAAQRETEEETGLSPQSGTWKDLDFSFDFLGRWGPAREHVFVLLLTGNRPSLRIDAHEHRDYRWLRLSDAYGELGFDSQRRALDQVSCYLLERDGESL